MWSCLSISGPFFFSDADRFKQRAYQGSLWRLTKPLVAMVTSPQSYFYLFIGNFKRSSTPLSRPVIWDTGVEPSFSPRPRKGESSQQMLGLTAEMWLKVGQYMCCWSYRVRGLSGFFLSLPEASRGSQQLLSSHRPQGGSKCSFKGWMVEWRQVCFILKNNWWDLQKHTEAQ